MKSRYYAMIFTTWHSYKDWLENDNNDKIISVLNSNSDSILITLERNKKLNEGK